MRARLLVATILPLTACGGGATRGPVTTLRPACPAGERWDGAACQARGGQADLDAAAAAISGLEIEDALAALDRAAARPLDHRSYVALWERRGMAHAVAQATPAAEAAFTRVLQADPGHAIDCDLGAPIFRPFQRAQAAHPIAPALELRWRRDLRLGEPVPIEIETIADPEEAMRDLTVYVRARGDAAWRAADVAVPAPGQIARLTLPPIAGTRPTALELFAVASDAQGNELHLWASPDRPREVALRYDPPTPWHRKWWVWAVAGGVVAAGTGVGVYAAVWQPSEKLGGTIAGAR